MNSATSPSRAHHSSNPPAPMPFSLSVCQARVADCQYWYRLLPDRSPRRPKTSLRAVVDTCWLWNSPHLSEIARGTSAASETPTPTSTRVASVARPARRDGRLQDGRAP